MIPGLDYPYRYTLYKNNKLVYSSWCICNVIEWKNSLEKKDKFYPTINFNYKIKDNQRGKKMLTFGEIEDGIDLIINEKKYRKTRPWGPQQFNASFIGRYEDWENVEIFTKFSDKQPVTIYIQSIEERLGITNE